jgi:hypothetical protein
MLLKLKQYFRFIFSFSPDNENLRDHSSRWTDRLSRKLAKSGERIRDKPLDVTVPAGYCQQKMHSDAEREGIASEAILAYPCTRDRYSLQCRDGRLVN